MSLRIYYKDNSNILISGITSSEPYPGNDAFVAGLDGSEHIIAVIPLTNVAAVVDEN